MMYRDSAQAVDEWVDQIFAAKSASTGGIVRRRIADVEGKVGLTRLRWEVAQRGFRLLEAGDQYVIVCTQKPIRVII